MKNKFLRWSAALVAAMIVVGALGATAAYAEDATPPAASDQPTGGRGPNGGGPGMGQAELEAAAKVLGITTDELSTALKDGKTLEDLAAAAGVDVQAVQDTIRAVRATERRTRIKQAVSDGTMTQEKADWLLEG